MPLASKVASSSTSTVMLGRAPTIKTFHAKATATAWRMSGAAAAVAGSTMMDAKKLAGLGVLRPAWVTGSAGRGCRRTKDADAGTDRHEKQHGKRHLRRKNRRERQRFLRSGRVSALGGEATGPASKFLMAPSRLKAVRPGAIPSRLPCRLDYWYLDLMKKGWEKFIRQAQQERRPIAAAL